MNGERKKGCWTIDDAGAIEDLTKINRNARLWLVDRIGNN